MKSHSQKSETSNSTNDERKNNSSGSGLNDFGDWSTTFLKLTIMLGGEYDASDLAIKNDTIKLLVLIFVLTAILLYNFINGLAIADVQELKEKGVFLDLQFKIYSILKYREMQETIGNNYRRKNINQENRVLRFLNKTIHNYMTSLVKRPNHFCNGKVTVYKTDIATAAIFDSIETKVLKFQFSRTAHDQLHEILSRKKIHESEKTANESEKNRTEKFGHNLKDGIKKLSESIESSNETINSKLEIVNKEIDEMKRSVEEKVANLQSENIKMKTELTEMKEILSTISTNTLSLNLSQQRFFQQFN